MVQCPQQQDAIDFRDKILIPNFAGSVKSLEEPYFSTQTGEFYRRIGAPISKSSDPKDQEEAADKLLSEMYPTNYLPLSRY